MAPSSATGPGLEGAKASIDLLQPEDIAEIVVFLASRPAHVNLQQVTIMPTAQEMAGVSRGKLRACGGDLTRETANGIIGCRGDSSKRQPAHP
jgi:hypothetical protein